MNKGTFTRLFEFNSLVLRMNHKQLCACAANVASKQFPEVIPTQCLLISSCLMEHLNTLFPKEGCTHGDFSVPHSQLSSLWLH